jgi:GNAT superfamily N-acetyltransferase
MPELAALAPVRQWLSHAERPERFRAANPADVAECVRIRGVTRENAVSAERLRSAGITVESWAKDVESGSLPGFVCESAGTVIGYCFGARATGEVVVLALLPEFEGRGIGRRLLGLVVDQLRGSGHERLFLGCSPDPSCRAYGFYRHLGWRSAGRFDRFGDEVLERDATAP